MNPEIMKSFDLMQYLKSFSQKRKVYFESFYVALLINIIIYGFKIFNQILSTDDYRGLRLEEWKQTLFNGRWFNELMASLLFHDELTVLPYLSTIYALFLYTGSGILTALILGSRDKFQIIIITLLITVTPYMAHNIYFNVNNWAVPTSTFFSVLALYLLTKSYRYILISVILFACAIGGYQTVIQVGILIIMGYIVKILMIDDVKYTKKLIANISAMIVLLPLSFLTSFFVIKAYSIINETSLMSRVSNIALKGGLADYLSRILYIYINHFAKTFVSLLYFRSEIAFFSLFLCLIAFFSCIYRIYFNTTANLTTKWIKVFLFLGLILLIPIVLHLPRVIGITYLPLRACYAIGFLLSLAFYFTSYIPGITRNIGVLAAFLCIIFSTFYINVLYFDAYRQTQSDLRRLNEITTRIRSDPRYTDIVEPFGLLIVGTKSMPVYGYKWNQQALNKRWSKYAAFEKFTDLKFHPIDKKTEREILYYLFFKPNSSYPSYNSIQYYKNNIILILDNQVIAKDPTVADNIFQKNIINKNIQPLPIISKDYNVYFNKDDNFIVYVKNDCKSEDLTSSIFLNIGIKEPTSERFIDTQGTHRNMDFRFKERATLLDNKCMAIVKLPDCKIKTINTGLRKNNELIWDVDIEVK